MRAPIEQIGDLLELDLPGLRAGGLPGHSPATVPLS